MVVVVVVVVVEVDVDAVAALPFTDGAIVDDAVGATFPPAPGTVTGTVVVVGTAVTEICCVADAGAY